jgi:hypothetical protein
MRGRGGGWRGGAGGRKAWENANTLESNRACETQLTACEDEIDSLAVRRVWRQCNVSSGLS